MPLPTEALAADCKSFDHTNSVPEDGTFNTWPAEPIVLGIVNAPIVTLPAVTNDNVLLPGSKSVSYTHLTLPTKA